MSQVDGVERRLAAQRRRDHLGDERVADHRRVVDVEAELGPDPGQRGEDEHGGENDSRVIPAVQWLRVAAAAAPESPHSQPESDERSDSRERVHRPRVEVALVDHAREPHCGTEDRGEGSRCDREPRTDARDRDPCERDRHERDREPGKDEHARGAGFESLTARVVQRPGRKTRVRHEDGQRDECEERPDPYRFQKARAAPLLHFPTSLD